MIRPRPWRPTVALAAAALALTAGAVEVRAQSGPDFLFKQPKVTVGIRGGYAVPQAGSEIFRFTRERLTVETSDFHAPVLGVDLAFRVDERLDLALGADFARSETDSEFRDWVGTDGFPILQTTRFDRTSLTVGVRAYLQERGRAVGRFAWIPGAWSPWVGAGAGWMNYVFVQEGEFVDFETLDIFNDYFRSDGWTPTVNVQAGMDVSLSPRLLLRTEGRYNWADADMGGDFVGFDEIDLSGFQLSVGISARF